jgi:hypothetical protein
MLQLGLNAPSKSDVDRFVKLIDTTLAADSVNNHRAPELIIAHE